MIATMMEVLVRVGLKRAPTVPEVAVRNAKGNTVVLEGMASIRERRPGELVHLRGEHGTICLACGGFAAVWFDNRDQWGMERWAKHPARCMGEEG